MRNNGNFTQFYILTLYKIMSNDYYYEFQPTITSFQDSPDPLEAEPDLGQGDLYDPGITFVKSRQIACLQYQVNKLEIQIGIYPPTRWINFTDQDDLWNQVLSSVGWSGLSTALTIIALYKESLDKYPIYDKLINDLKDRCEYLLTNHYQWLDKSEIFHPEYRIKPPAILNYGYDWITETDHIYTRTIQQLRYFLEMIDSFGECWTYFTPDINHTMDYSWSGLGDPLYKEQYNTITNYKSLANYKVSNETYWSYNSGYVGLPSTNSFATKTEDGLQLGVDTVLGTRQTITSRVEVENLYDYFGDPGHGATWVLPDTVINFNISELVKTAEEYTFNNNVTKLLIRVQPASSGTSYFFNFNIEATGEYTINIWDKIHEAYPSLSLEEFYNGTQSTTGVMLKTVLFQASTIMTNSDGASATSQIRFTIQDFNILRHYKNDYYKEKTEFVYP